MDNAADMDTALAMEYVMDMGNANRNTFRENGNQLEALVFTLKAARALALAVAVSYTHLTLPTTPYV